MLSTKRVASTVKLMPRFCKQHNADANIIPQGLLKGYKNVIDFESISTRLELYDPRIVGIIKGKIKSTFNKDIQKVYTEHGKAYAEGIGMVLKKHKLCGYYGWIGTKKVADHIFEKYLVPDSPLTRATAAPQTVNDFIEFVLVPEAGLCLIAQDMDLDLNDSKQKKEVLKIMADSSAFGDIVFENI